MIRAHRTPTPRLRAVLAVVGVVACAGCLPVAASAQNEPAVQVRLVRQSAWVGPDRPLRLVIEATNRGDEPLDSLALVLTVQAIVRSRSVYDLSLRADATANLFSYPFFQTGVLRAGRTREFELRPDLSFLAARGESGIYPLAVHVLAGDVPLATLRTPMIYLFERPHVPLNLAWTWVLSAPVEYTPQGVFLDGPLMRDIRRGGRLREAIRALAESGQPADVALSPVLVDQLARMARGFRLAGPGGAPTEVPAGEGAAKTAHRLLAALRRIVTRPTTELAVLPFGEPSVPALYRAGLGADLPALLGRGRETLAAAFGIPPDSRALASGVFRPPLSHVDPGTLARLAEQGAETLLLNPGFVPRSVQKYTPKPVVRLEGSDRTVNAVLPDAMLAARPGGSPDDPTLAAHATLGELAAIWFERPGTSGRGAAMIFDERARLPSGFLVSFAVLVHASPWLRPLSASALAHLVANPAHAALGPRGYPGFGHGYVNELSRARRALKSFGMTARGAQPLVARLRDELFLAEGQTFLADPLRGLSFIRAVRAAISRTYAAVQLRTKVVTLTSTQRRIGVPITILNSSGYPMRVRIRLVSDRRLVFPSGNVRRVTLGEQASTYQFPVLAQTTGRIPVKVQILTDGPVSKADTLTEVEIVVRSTAYNRVALLLTIGAALFLIVWWGRRLLLRRRT